jgi:hypothetical protein
MGCWWMKGFDMSSRPEGLNKDYERRLYDMMHLDVEDVIRELENLCLITISPLVSSVDAKEVNIIASNAIKIIRKLQDNKD